MDSEQIRKLKAWKLRADIDYIELYVNLWIGFNSWFVTRSGAERNDRAGIEWVKSYSELKKLYEDGLLVHSSILKQIQAFLGADPMEQNASYWSGKLSSLTSWNEIVEFLYQVRCNLFHGRKNPEDFKDTELVEYAYKCLYEIFDYIVLEANRISAEEEIPWWKRWKELSDKSRDLLSEFNEAAQQGDRELASIKLNQWKQAKAEMKNIRDSNKSEMING